MTIRAALLLSAVACLTCLATGAAHAQDAGSADRGTLQARPGFRDAVTAPLEDLNLRKTDVPDVLKRAAAAPYDMAGLDRCEAIAGEVGRLDGVLGRDLEEAPPPDRRTKVQKAAGAAHDLAVGAVQDRTRAVLPFRGWIRKLTGAEHNQKALDAGIRAGEVRRGYLKGVGMRMNCAPPAAPSWFVPVKPTAARPVPPPQPVWMRWWSAVVAWFQATKMRLIGG